MNERGQCCRSGSQVRGTGVYQCEGLVRRRGGLEKRRLSVGGLIRGHTEALNKRPYTLFCSNSHREVKNRSRKTRLWFTPERGLETRFRPSGLLEQWSNGLQLLEGPGYAEKASKPCLLRILPGKSQTSGFPILHYSILYMKKNPSEPLSLIWPKRPGFVFKLNPYPVPLS